MLSRRAIELGQAPWPASDSLSRDLHRRLSFPADRAGGIAVSSTQMRLSRRLVTRIIFCCISPTTAARLHCAGDGAIGQPLCD